jgi:adhesin transport system outer membrane protein
MISKTKLTVLSLAMLTSLGALAQTLPTPMVQAARKAVASNPEVQARWNGFKAAASERDVARGGYFPQLDLKASGGRENRDSPLAPAGGYGSYNFNTSQLSLTQMLFDGMLTVSEVKRLGYAKLTRYYELSEASETVALEAVRAYADVLRYRELVDAATQNFAEHKQVTAHVEERAAGGVGRRVDVEQANGRLALAESNLLTELTHLHDASARYLRVVGEKPPANLPALADPFKLGTLPASFDVLMREGLQGSPTLNAAVENVRAYKTAIASRKAPNMPRVDFRAYASADNNTGGIIGNTRANGTEVLLNYNLFRGGADAARGQQALDQAEQARDLQEKACRDVRQTLSIAYSDVRSLTEQQRYMDQHRLATEKSREAYRQQFDIGQRTLLDLLDSQNEFFEATRSYINAHHNQVAAQARTLAGMGQLVGALGVNRADMPSAQDAGQGRSGLDPAELCPPETTQVETLDAIKARFATKPKRPAADGSYVVLIPSPDGSIGRVTVQGKQGEQVLTKAGQMALMDGSGAPSSVSKQQLDRDFGAAVAALPPIPEQFILYFNRGSTQLTKASQAQLVDILARARARKVLDIWLIGHTDTVGSAERNQALGLKRAQAIAKRLQQLGLKDTVVSVDSYGKSSPLVATPDETDEPRNRRSEVYLR